MSKFLGIDFSQKHNLLVTFT